MTSHAPVHVGYLENSSKIGGGNRSMETLLRGLEGSRFHPHFVCPEEGPMVKLIQSLHVDVKVIAPYQPSWRSPLRSYHAWQRWKQFLRSDQIALIHANGLQGGRSIVMAAHSTGIPLICHIRFPSSEESYAWFFQRLPKPFGFIFISEAIQREVGGFLEQACPSARQWIVYNGVDIHTFSPSSSDNVTPRIGIIANLQPIKGHEDFLDMAANLTEQGHHAQYDIIGADIQQQGRLSILRQYAQGLGLSDRVHFHGQVDNVAELVKQLDVVVCASHIEPFGRCLIEGMACAKPIVATRVGGIPEVVENRKTGFLVEPHAPGELAEAVLQLLGDPTLRKNMGTEGRARVERLFSLEAHTASIIKVYQETLGLA
ncbi:hypothetical protein CSB45_04920 [candidate division KSB3 bacterium]|uniref:Glycosyl transferase family 1 n=1 Tax=candidate division KSB3 bacterium TaxID=2044937 RepID=A0A2G6E7L5_9BACT|nr:MAG: hypothetical protein CSB45_04920 [candidate division KSB3 bacterium]PIE30398.1 MAG: hypothetical protein CSA57_03690 [candidate division KSB3 bacterium]